MRQKKTRRGQAALEYLVTYGWGFLIILVVIGALAYFGFLNPTRYIPSRCAFGAQLDCTDYKLEADPNLIQHGVAYITFRNNFGDSINITKIATVSGKSVNNSVNIPIVKGTTSSIVLLQLDPADEIFLVKGERMAVPLNVTFRRDTSRFPTSPIHGIIGEIFTTVQ